MSSDYLNFELSKELKGLGIEFKKTKHSKTSAFCERPVKQMDMTGKFIKRFDNVVNAATEIYPNNVSNARAGISSCINRIGRNGIYKGFKWQFVGKEKWTSIVHPTASQLIDKFMELTDWDKDVDISPRAGTYDIEWDILTKKEFERGCVSERCFTTALGKALIALIKETN